MTLTINGKNWFAMNAGSGTPTYCYVTSGLTYYDADGVIHTGGTVEVVASFVGAHLVNKDTAIIIANTNYTQLKVINDNTDLTIDDVTWVNNNSTYCYVCGIPICSFTLT